MSLLKAYADAWADGRASAIAEFWAPGRFRFYKAEEVADPFLTWDAALAYWQANEPMHERVLLHFANISELPLDGGWAMLIAQMRWDIRFSAHASAGMAGKAMGGDNHVIALLHDDKLTGWCEAPDAPISYIRRLYEQSARI